MKDTRYVLRKRESLRVFEDGSKEKQEYQEFLDKVVKEFGNYLPEQYREYAISVEKVPKNNVMKDSLRIVNPEVKEAYPNLYIDELYRMHREGMPLEEILQTGAAMFTYGMDYAREMSAISARACGRRDNIIAQIVNTDRNLEMLRDIPHTDYLDLSVIYRHYVALPDGTFNLATVSDEEMENMELSLEELHKLALVNTRRIMPVKREHVGEGVYLLSNKKRLLGANALLFKGQMRWIARKCRSDIFLAASSIHEVMVIPVEEARLSFLRRTVREANKNVVHSEDVLSDTVYRYDRERDMLLPAWEDPAEPKIWDDSISCN